MVCPPIYVSKYAHSIKWQLGGCLFYIKWASFSFFSSFPHCNNNYNNSNKFQQYKLKKALMVCMGFEPCAADW